jgi:hypothetical protein
MSPVPQSPVSVSGCVAVSPASCGISVAEEVPGSA